MFWTKGIGSYCTPALLISPPRRVSRRPSIHTRRRARRCRAQREEFGFQTAFDNGCVYIAELNRTGLTMRFPLSGRTSLFVPVRTHMRKSDDLTAAPPPPPHGGGDTSLVGASTCGGCVDALRHKPSFCGRSRDSLPSVVVVLLCLSALGDF